MSSMINIYGVWSRGEGGYLAILAVTQDVGFCSLLELPLLIEFNDTEGAHKDLAPRPLILDELTLIYCHFKGEWETFIMWCTPFQNKQWT